MAKKNEELDEETLAVIQWCIEVEGFLVKGGATQAQAQEFIEEEIVARFEFQKGRIEVALKNDKDIVEAKTLLSNLQKLNSILTTIEKPTKPFNTNKRF